MNLTNQLFMDEFNADFYTKTIKAQRVITKKHPLADKAKEYLTASKHYPDFSVFGLIEDATKIGYFKAFTINLFKKIKAYKDNPLEVEARQAAKEISQKLKTSQPY